MAIYRRDPIKVAPARPGVTPEVLTASPRALGWLADEQPVLLAAVARAANEGFDVHAWQLAWCLYSFLDWRGSWHDQAAVQRTGLDAAGRLGDRHAQARAQVCLAQAHTRLRDFRDAEDQLARALTLYEELDDRTGPARTHLNLGQLFGRRGDNERSLRHGLRALGLHRETGHRSGQAEALNEVGWTCALLGRYDQAIVHCAQALDLLRGLDHPHAEAATWDSLGYAHHHLGQIRQATDCYRQALTLYRELGDR
jgi:tetratricopeptide (TPR) repeat protein